MPPRSRRSMAARNTSRRFSRYLASRRPVMYRRLSAAAPNPSTSSAIRQVMRGRGFVTSSSVHNFTRVVYSQQLVAVDPSSAVPYGFSFSLNDLTNAADFTTLYDQYRILKVEVELMPTVTGANPVNYTVIGGNIHSAIDYDSSTNPTVSELVQYSSYKGTKLDRTHKRVIYPRTATSVYAGVATTGYSQSKYGQWIDCNSPGVVHYGLRALIDPCPQIVQGTMWISYRAKYYIQCKNIR